MHSQSSDLRITCPHCGTTSRIPGHMWGKRIRCPKCKESLQISSGSNDRTERERVQSRSEPPRSSRRDYDDRDQVQRKRPSPRRQGHDEYDEDQKFQRRTRKAKKRSGGSAGWIIGLAAGGVGLVVVVAVLVIVLVSGSTGAEEPGGRKSNPQAKVAQTANPSVKPQPADPQGNITSNTVRKTKNATVYLRITTATGQVGEGSGFFAVEPGVIITNAHVLGMLSKTSAPPRKVEVVLNSGETSERRLNGQVLGVDRATDLAVVRVANNGGPTPLPLGPTGSLVETQKVWIFGFPLGKELGSNITVSDSTVSSLRKDNQGLLERIQVNGGMHPGNSGGPVVDSAGNVIGVSVAGIRGTQINFAVPADYVQMLLDGRLLSSTIGEPYNSEAGIRVPVQCACLDPFGRVDEVRVEVWSGRPGKDRPSALSPPKSEAGDGIKQVQRLAYQNTIAKAEVVLPRVNPGEVVWIQPSVVSTTGKIQWGPAMAMAPDRALNREPAMLAVKLFEQRDRTVRLTTSKSIQFIQADKSFLASADAQVAMAERMLPDRLGALVPTGFGRPQISYTEDGRKMTADSTVTTILSSIAPRFVVDTTNKLRARADNNLNPRIALETREEVMSFYKMICKGYEISNITIPNRQLLPKEKWQTKVPMLLLAGKIAKVVDLNLTCEFEGVRTVGGAKHAVVTLSGRVEGRQELAGKVDGEVGGTFSFDLQNGYISAAKMRISSETAITSDFQVVAKFDVDLQRSPGNSLGISLRNLPNKSAPKPTPPMMGRQIAKLQGVLSPNDVRDTKLLKKGSPMKAIPVKLVAGKTYTFTLSSTAFDPYLAVVSPTRQLLARDDDGAGNLNSRITFRAPMTGSYSLLVTTYNGKMGAFQLTIHQGP